MNQVKDFFTRYVDARLVVSAVVASMVIGGVVVAANASGIKPLKKVANAAK